MKCGARSLPTEESGFTLAELLVTILILFVVTTALYNIFDMSLRVYSYGNAETEAIEDARVGLERMEREIRAAHPYNLTNNTQTSPVTSDDYIFFTTPTSTTVSGLTVTSTNNSFTQLTFGNDQQSVGTTGHQQLQCGSPCEYITYKLTSSSNTATPCTSFPCVLRRDATSFGSSSTSTGGQEVVGNVNYVSASNPGLKFTLLKKDSSGNYVAPTSEAEVSTVRITLRIRVDDIQDGTQTLTTDVDLRNR